MGNNDCSNNSKIVRIYNDDNARINTKKLPNGRSSAVQISKDKGIKPLEYENVNENELFRTEYIEKPFTPLQNIFVNTLTNITTHYAGKGLEKLSNWFLSDALPVIKSKFIKKEKNDIETNKLKSTAVTSNNVNQENIKQDATNTPEITMEEAISIANIAQRSALLFAASINLLKNSIVNDKNLDSDSNLEKQRMYEKLNTKETIDFIDLLLDEKNKTALDQASIDMLVAFRNGCFIIDNNQVPISEYLHLE